MSGGRSVNLAPFFTPVSRQNSLLVSFFSRNGGYAMAQYCTCATCVNSIAQPAQRVQTDMESIQGAQVVMQQGWTLVHWSAADFTEMKSTEIHNFIQRGYKFRV
jgi:hypothetical protein